MDIQQMTKRIAELNATIRLLEKERSDLQRETQRIASLSQIAVLGLKKEMVVTTSEHPGWAGTVGKFLEWIAANRPHAKWYEFNGGVYRVGDMYTGESVIRYQDLK